MPTINVTKSFPFSPDGKTVIEYDKGQHDVSERCAVVAVDQLKVATLISDEDKGSAEKEAEAQKQAEAKAAADAEAKALEEKAKAETEAKAAETKAAKATTKK
tara:strand:+ start:723 stop:1031 length:309 start_codon:yes stop_codon:yes gene_type:complete